MRKRIIKHTSISLGQSHLSAKTLLSITSALFVSPNGYDGYSPHFFHSKIFAFGGTSHHQQVVPNFQLSIKVTPITQTLRWIYL